ncbi:unnamed protein product [Rhizophagus irregularis]|nr:unnamed protein product [Rhizophagus irregularis]
MYLVAVFPPPLPPQMNQGPDLADYPMDTVPNKVNICLWLSNSMIGNNVNQDLVFLKKKGQKTPFVDYLRPIIADADTGHAWYYCHIKLTKMFVERGAAGITSNKKCGHMAGKRYWCRYQEHINRLIAIRVQFISWSVNNLIVSRTDSEAATLLTSNIDVRDHAPSFNWDAAGMTDEEIRTYISDLGKLGFVWQFITLGGFHSNALGVDTFARDYKDVVCFVREGVQRKEREHGVETLQHQKWSGAHYVDR